MSESKSDSSDQRERTGPPAPETKGPAHWVPKGALSRFMLQGAAFAFVTQVLALVSGFASQVLLARLLSPEGLGIYFLTQSVVIMTANVGELGLNRPLARMISTDVGSNRVGAALRVLRSGAGIASLSGMLVVGLFVGGIGQRIAVDVFDSPLMAGSVLLVGFWIVGRIALDIASAGFQGLHRVGLSALFSTALSPTIIAVVCGFLLYSGASLDYASSIVIASSAALFGGVVGLVMVWIPFSKVAPAGPPRTRELMTSTLPIFGAGMLQAAAIQADLWIVGAQLDPAEVALYGAAKRLTVLVGFPLAVLAFVVPPLIADLHAKGERERLQRLVRAATTVASLPAAAAFVLFIAFGSEILALVYGEAYADAALVLKILIVDKLVFLMMGPGSLTLVMAGHERVVFRITMVSATASLLAMYLGGRFGGVVGVALAYALSSSATGLWYLIEARRHTGIWVHASPLSIKPIIEIIRSTLHGRS